MRAILILARRELRRMFISPLAWTLLAVLFGITAFMFNAAVQSYLLYQMQYQQMAAMGGGQAMDISLTDSTIAPYLGNAAVLMLLVMPLITMRLIADEKRQETWPALASSPLSPMQIILGKYLGLMFFITIFTLLLALPPLTLTQYGNPDMGQLFSGLLGIFLTTATFGAIGLAASSLTDNPIVAAVVTFGALLALWIIDWMSGGADTLSGNIFGYLSLTRHYQSFLKGVITSTDLIYFLLVISAGLFFARQRLVQERTTG